MIILSKKHGKMLVAILFFTGNIQIRGKIMYIYKLVLLLVGLHVGGGHLGANMMDMKRSLKD